ncbi:MAG: DinB family protein [Planctomycetota bacterium]|jgi:hypothetical protein
MPSLKPLADRLAFNDRFLDQLIEGFTETDWLHRAGQANHPQWLLGHLAATRRWALRLLGLATEEESWEAHFGQGTPPSAQGDDIAPELLREAFLKAGERLREHLSSATQEQIDAPFREFPDGSRTMGGGVHFLHFHEAYHLGQIGLLRRVTGKPGLV